MNYWIIAGTALAGLAVGYGQMKLLGAMVPMRSGGRTALFAVCKLALWAAVIVGALVIGLDALVGVMAGSALYYTGTAIHQMRSMRKGE